MKKIIFSLLVGLISTIALTANAAEFDDVYTKHINKEAIEYLKQNDIIKGYDDSTYKPENRINRAEFIKIVVGSQVDNPTGSNCFKDVKDDWFAKYVCTAKRLGYIKGYPDGTFRPANYINFVEASKIIAKALSIQGDNTGTRNEWFAGYVKGLEKKKAIPSTIQFFDKNISRGEMAEIVWRLKENKTDKVSQNYETITSNFPSIQSCEALKEKFDEYQSYQHRPHYYRKDGIMLMDDMVDFDVSEEADFAGEAMEMKSMAAPQATTAGKAKKSEASDDFSTTNIQVKGVDEADIIKNDGEYIYLIKGNTIRIVKAYPPSDMEEITKLQFDDGQFNPREMYVNQDQLIVIGETWGGYYPNSKISELKRMVITPHPYRGAKTKVYTFDMSDRADIKEERVVTYDGNYHTSRRINDNMYIILNETPNYWTLDNIKSGEELLPQFKDGDKAVKPMVECGTIRYFPGHAQPNYLIVSSIPLNDSEGKIQREVFLGSSNNVYSSRTHLYVATNEVNYDHYTDWNWQNDHASTLVFRFSLDDGEIDFKGRGRVPGRILNQFSMDAHKNHFRIATTIGETWNSANPSTSNVYVLDKDMKTVGKLEELAPGEKIYSTRFMGDRLYMVTFKQVDPLFVIDLKNPKAPKVLGKLKSPGFSDYLHPYDEDHIIGFGKDTTEIKGGVRMQGMKIALFDVSDVKNPKQKFVESIGDRGTDSELLRNHKALLFDKEKELLAFPINIIEKINPENLQCSKFRYSTCPNNCQKRCIPSSCSEETDGTAVCTQDCDGLGSCTNPSYERYETTFSGALVYKLNLKDGFTQKGRLTHYNEEEILKMGSYWPYNYDKNIQRIIYIGKYLYSISAGMVKASEMDTVKEVKAVDLK